MKQIQSFLVRAVCSIAVGVLLILYRDQTIIWLTVAIGALFFVSGLISCAFYLGQRSRNEKETLYDVDGNPLKEQHPTFPVAGVGSLVLGAILALMHEQFSVWGSYVLAAILVIGTINQYTILARTRKYCTIGAFYWVVATIILLIALLIIAKPDMVGELKLKIIGWALMVYGVTEVIIGINSYRARRRYEDEMAKRQLAAQEVQESMVEDAAAEEVKEETSQQEETSENGIEDAVIVDIED